MSLNNLLPAAPAADSAANVLAEWNAIYDAYNEVACLILGSMTHELHKEFKNSSPYDMIKELKSMFEKQAGVERFDLIQTFHACKQEEGKPVATYVLQIKGYVDQLERLGYMLPQDLIVGLILNDLTKDFAGFVRNYNMHNMGKTIGELHTMLIEYEKGGGSLEEELSSLSCLVVEEKEASWLSQFFSNGIYEIDMHDLVPNVNSIYNVSTKKGKMTRKSFSHSPERATDLLEIIHTDVCGPLRHVSRQGASYFITFTDDYSRYGYVYLLKHKHEVFETFKVFKNEVENQLGKTIKALRSDRGGEYISQEFKDYLKACGIIQQLTPPYTPQHNDVSERRNRTLLDMDTQRKQWVTIFTSYLKKIVVARYAEFFEKNLITQEVSGRAVDLEEIQDEDISPFKITSEIPMEVEGFEPPQEEVILIHNIVWVLVDLPPNCKTVGSKWIFKKKTDMDGIVHTYKARLIAKGYTHLYGVDYEEMFSPVADIRAIRILISIAAYYDYEIWKMDKSMQASKIHLWSKQASMSWNKRFDEEIKKFGFAQNIDEPCVYQKANGSNVTFLILYVDDIIIMGNHIPSSQSVKDYLGKCFAMKDLEEATFILGIKIYKDRSKRLIGLCQNAYMDKILKRYKMDISKRGHIPMQERLDLNKTQGASTLKKVKRIQNVPYASAVGSIMYAVRCTRPDVAFAQNITSRFQQNPAEMEAVWIRKFISRLGIVPTINEPIKMFCENSAALLIASEPGVHMGTRRYHRSNLLKVHTYDNLAYPFTKALPEGKLTQHARSMGLHLASSFM
nr:hypothetical protein [Tanacetum cinerariifolium]